MNYKGYFNGIDNKHYKVELIGDSASGEYTEIMLAGDNPFTVQYTESLTPFDPLRTSVATINIVNDNYLEDILSVHAKDTIVKLIQYSGTNETIVWCGYLSPKMYNQPYENCWETISLNANDCLTTLQYSKYTEMNGRGITNIKDIIDNIVTNCGLLDGYYWTRSKKVGTSVLLPNQLLIPEQNFYFNDTDDSWSLQEVLEEICRYLGFTALQWEQNYISLIIKHWLLMMMYMQLGMAKQMVTHKEQPPILFPPRPLTVIVIDLMEPQYHLSLYITRWLLIAT